MSYVDELTNGSGAVRRMEHAGCVAQLMRAKRLQGDGTHMLPPGTAVPVFPIVALPGAPDHWVREAGTYVCPVEVGWGLWFDWTMNDPLNTAVVASVKGVNPVTGQKLTGLALESYCDRCPEHGESFAHGRLCRKCGYEWPPQNYVCSPNRLWWDGFRQPDGTVRQFFFTDEDARDIASLLAGEGNTVPAFGFAFWRPEQPRRRESQAPWMKRLAPASSSTVGQIGPVDHCAVSFGRKRESMWTELGSSQPGAETANLMSSDEPVPNLTRTIKSLFSDDDHGVREKGPMVDGDGRDEDAPEPPKSKSVSVGAGAAIRQQLAPCDIGVDGWKDEPQSVIRLYFCFEPQFRKIVGDGGVLDLSGDDAGFMRGLPVGD